MNEEYIHDAYVADWRLHMKEADQDMNKYESDFRACGGYGCGL